MVTDNHYRWDFIGLSTDQKPTPATSDKVVDGSTFYCCDTSKLYVFCKDTWYERKALGSGGGGTSYTAGTGIEIEDKEISVDTDTIQEKMSAGDFVSILNNAISSSISKELTTADYDDDPTNPRCIILCNLPDGFYHKKSGVKLYVNQYAGIPFPYDSFWVMSTKSDNVKYVFASSPYSYDQYGSEVLRMYSVDTQNKQLLERYSFLSSGDVIDNLTSTSTVYPLSANQGKVLKDLIDSLVVKDAGAPTTSTVGTIGKLYEDTTNGKLYQCTAVSGSTYTWSELGAGGGGDTVYSNKTTSSSNTGGAVYIGNLNASQVEQADPTTTDNNRKYFWALPYDNTLTPGDNSVNILGYIKSNAYESIAIGNGNVNAATVHGNQGIAIGSNAQSGQSSLALGGNANAGTTGSNRSGMIAIGNGAQADVDKAICIGGSGSSYGVVNSASKASVALGYKATIGGVAGYKNSVALGAYSRATRQGEVNVGLVIDETTGGYNDTAYRVIGGVHDGVDTHDAATVAQGNTLATSAPTTSTVGVLGQLYTDTTNMHTYQCTAISGDTYTWTQRW